ncbi:protein kinase domain-containing protein [Corallococcus silvisoli]|uniref:protein kinase domain-containing protein n=1 Tax=Corallococcus silvisoli TaxID=2697031 RepID=UPI00191C3D91|nr:protein kinase [Corallococcus silvisoli]
MATPVEPEALTGPVRFGPYTLVRRIGAGGMGEVFLAREEGVGRAVVVKKVLPGLVDSRQFVGRFRDEARVVVRLAHPNIARVYAMGEVDGQLFLAMEYVLGKTLSRLAYRLRQRQRLMPLGPLLQLGQRLCEGLAYAHDATDEEGHPLHLVHRDLSPANVCVSYAGEVKIIDFGAAQSTLKEQQTAPRVVIGNLTYMAPEQARKRTVDRRADLYAVGVVLWELFSWKPLSQRGDPLERWRRAAYPQWEPAGRYRPDLPRAVDAFLVRALASEPNDRFPTATAMAEALAALKEKLAPEATDQDLVRLMSAAFPREKVVEQQTLDALLREQPERASTQQEFPSVDLPPTADLLRAQEDIETEALDAAKLRRAANVSAGQETEALDAAQVEQALRAARLDAGAGLSAGQETEALDAAQVEQALRAARLGAGLSAGQETEALDSAQVEQALRAAAALKAASTEGAVARRPWVVVADEGGLRRAPPVRLHNQEVTKDAWVPGVGTAEPTAPGQPPLSGWGTSAGVAEPTAPGQPSQPGQGTSAGVAEPTAPGQPSQPGQGTSAGVVEPTAPGPSLLSGQSTSAGVVESTAPGQPPPNGWAPGTGAAESTAPGQPPPNGWSTGPGIAEPTAPGQPRPSGWAPGPGIAEPTASVTPPPADGTPGAGGEAATAYERSMPHRAEWTPGSGSDDATPREASTPTEPSRGPGSEDPTDPGEGAREGADSSPDRQAAVGQPRHIDWNPSPDAEDSASHLRASHREGPPLAPEDSPMQNRPSRPGWTPGAGSEDSTTNERPSRKSGAGSAGWTPGSGEDDATEGAAPLARHPDTDDEEESTDVEKPGRSKANPPPAQRAPAPTARPNTSVGAAPQSRSGAEASPARPNTSVGAAPQARPAAPSRPAGGDDPQSRPATSVGAAPQARPAAPPPTESFPDATRPMSKEELPVPWTPSGAGEATEALEAAKIFGALSQTTGNMPAYLAEKAAPYVPPKEIPRRQAPVVDERPHETRPMQVRTKTRETLVGYDMDISAALKEAELKRREAELAAQKRDNKKKPAKSSGPGMPRLWPIPPQYRFWAMLAVVALAVGLGFGLVWLSLGLGGGD